jgi:type VI secretion system IcmF/VasK family protein
MQRVLKLIMKEGASSIVILVLLLALIWGASYYTRGDNANWMNLPMLITMIVIGLWIAMFIANKVMSARNAMRIEKQLQAQSGAQVEGASADKRAEAEALRKKFNESLDALKRTKGGKSALYTLPWYVIIGPPGSGKTTALQESGLNFPAIQGGAKVRGIGGTRNCDWWFTEDGILLDTAGRYTTVAEDQEEWLSFLEMIRTSRKTKPINGAIVAVSIDDLFRGTQTEIDQMAKDVRNRLDELSARLHAVFPVYLMFTKCDLVRGFVEFFEDFNKEERAQVWGFTMPYSLPEKQYTALFDEQLNRMQDNLRARQHELLGTERPAQKKQNIYLFPRQFQLAREKMKDLIGQLFGATAFQEAAILRGVYFTSGTQKGTPIDQLMTRLGEAMGMSGAPEGADERMEKKSFFIHNLFARVMFPDKTLARSTSKLIRRRMAWKLALQILSVTVFALITYGAVSAFGASRNTINSVESAGTAVAEAPDAAAGAEFVAKLEALDQLRDSLTRASDRSQAGWSWGMDQSSRMFDAGAQKYVDAIRPVFITPASKRVEAELRNRLNNIRAESSEEDWQVLLNLWRVYGMLAGDIEPQPALIATELKRPGRWIEAQPGDNASHIESLAGEQLEFYSTLVAKAHNERERYPWLISADRDLLVRAQNRLKDGYWIPNAYNVIISYAAKAIGPLTLKDILPENQGLLELRLNEATATDLSRLSAFTQSAWESQVQPMMQSRAGELQKLMQELGRADKEDKILAELYRLHRDRHERVWRDFLNYVHPVSSGFRSVPNARDNLLSLTSKSTSPLNTLITNVWKRRELQLTSTMSVKGWEQKDEEVLADAMGSLAEYVSAYDTFTQNTGDGRRVSSYDIAKMDNAVDILAAATTRTGVAITQKLDETKKPARDLLVRVIKAGFEGLKADARTEIETMWRTRIVKYWQDNLAGKYPFKPDSAEEASLAKVSEFFSPASGVFKAFNLQTSQLRNLSFYGETLFEPSDTFIEVEKHFLRVRRALFAKEEDQRISVEFKLQTKSYGALLRGTKIVVGRDEKNDEQSLVLLQTSVDWRQFSWPYFGDAQKGPWVGSSVEFKYAADREAAVVLEKPKSEWGLFRLLHDPKSSFVATNPKPEGPGTEFLMTWQFTAVQPQREFEWIAKLTADSPDNPFAKGFFTGFAPREGMIR